MKLYLNSFTFRSLSVWNIMEEDFWHPNWHEQRRYVPSQVVTPNVEHLKINDCDFGAVVAIKGMYTNVDVDLLNGYNPKQVSRWR